MTDAPKLSEIVNEWRAEFGYGGILEISLYGIEKVCPDCGGSGYPHSDNARRPCSRCNGTGKVRSGGLVERVQQRASEMTKGGAGVEAHAGFVLEALRTELGEGSE